MTQRTHRGVTIECVQGDIAAQPDLDAVVNAADTELHQRTLEATLEATLGPTNVT